MVAVDTPKPLRLGSVKLLELFYVLDNIPTREAAFFRECLGRDAGDLVRLRVMPLTRKGHRVCGVPSHALEFSCRVLNMVLKGFVIVTDRRNVDAFDTGVRLFKAVEKHATLRSGVCRRYVQREAQVIDRVRDDRVELLAPGLHN